MLTATGISEKASYAPSYNKQSTSDCGHHHVNPSDSTIRGGSSHLLTSASLELHGSDTRLSRDTSPGHHQAGGCISPRLTSPRWPSKTAAGAIPAHGPWTKSTIATPRLATDRTPALAELCTGAMQI